MVPVRLKDGHQPAAWVSRLDALKDRFQFGGIVRVIVHDQDAFFLSQRFKPPANPSELGQRLRDERKRNLQLKPDAHSGERVQDIVRAWERKARRSELLAFVKRLEYGGVFAVGCVRRAHIRAVPKNP